MSGCVKDGGGALFKNSVDLIKMELDYSQLKKRWLMDSFALLHRRHVV